MWLSKKDLEDIYKCSASTIRRWTKELGISSSKYYLADEILPKLDRFYEKYKLRKNSFKKVEPRKIQGKFSKRDLEKYFLKADTTIVRWIRTAGLSTSKRLYSIEEVEKIKAVSVLYSSGYTTKEIICGKRRHIGAIDVGVIGST